MTFGQIDYDIALAENGWWQIGKTCHVNPVPGDNEPEYEHVGERETIEEALTFTKNLARLDLDNNITQAATIFVNGSEVWCKGE